MGEPAYKHEDFYGPPWRSRLLLQLRPLRRHVGPGSCAPWDGSPARPRSTPSTSASCCCGAMSSASLLETARENPPHREAMDRHPRGRGHRPHQDPGPRWPTAWPNGATGVRLLEDEADIDRILATTETGDVWGIGRRGARYLAALRRTHGPGLARRPRRLGPPSPDRDGPAHGPGIAPAPVHRPGGRPASDPFPGLLALLRPEGWKA